MANSDMMKNEPRDVRIVKDDRLIQKLTNSGISVVGMSILLVAAWQAFTALQVPLYFWVLYALGAIVTGIAALQFLSYVLRMMNRSPQPIASFDGDITSKDAIRHYINDIVGRTDG